MPGGRRGWGRAQAAAGRAGELPVPDQAQCDHVAVGEVGQARAQRGAAGEAAQDRNAAERGLQGAGQVGEDDDEKELHRHGHADARRRTRPEGDAQDGQQGLREWRKVSHRVIIYN